MPRRLATALPSWVLALVGTGFALSLDATRWPWAISAVMGASIVLSFVVQLSIQRKEGLVNRLALTTAGSLAIGAVGVVLAWSLHGLG